GCATKTTPSALDSMRMNSKLCVCPLVTVRLIPINMSPPGRVQCSSMQAAPRVICQSPAIQARLSSDTGGEAAAAAAKRNAAEWIDSIRFVSLADSRHPFRRIQALACLEADECLDRHGGR